MIKISFLFFTIFFSLSTYAKPGKPVKHAHNGRYHVHVLPNSGIGGHNHNRGKSKVRANNKTNVNSNDGVTTKLDYVVKDQNGCFVYLPWHVRNKVRGRSKASAKWTGQCVGGYIKGKGVITYYINNHKLYTDSREKDAKADIYSKYRNESSTETNFDDNHFKSFMNQFDLKELVKFYNKKPSYSWSPGKKNIHNVGINGEGKIRFTIENPDFSHNYSIYVIGNFKNGRLINNGTLKILLLDVEEEYEVSSKTNLANLIKKESKTINSVARARKKERVKQARARKARDRERNTRSYSSNDTVMITFSSVCGFSLCSDKNLQVSGGPGNFNSTYSGSATGYISKGYNGGLAGRYNWSAQFDKHACSGSFYLSGSKRNYNISVYDNCSDAGSREY